MLANVIYIAQNASFLVLKCTKSVSGWGSAPDPAGGAYSAPPDPLAGFGGGERGGGGEVRGWVFDFWPYRCPPGRKFLATGLALSNDT